MTQGTLQIRKQQLVRNAIFDAAIDLFAVKGFDETTVEEVAQAAGVSRRSFFRYFASKDDLLAQNVVRYGFALTQAISECPATFTPFEIVRKTILAVAKQTAAHPRTRQIIEISERSISARQAHSSRMMEVEDSVAKAFAKRLRSGSKDELKPRLLASLTLSVMNVAVISWFRGEYQDLSVAARQALSGLTRIFCDQISPTSPRYAVVIRQKPANSDERRKSGAAMLARR